MINNQYDKKIILRQGLSLIYIGGVLIGGKRKSFLYYERRAR